VSIEIKPFVMAVLENHGWVNHFDLVLLIAVHAIWKKHGKDDHVTTTTKLPYPPKG